MTINKNQQGTELEIKLVGRLDTTTAPKHSVNGITSLVMDFAELEYISSAGLRVLLAAQKVMNKQGTMVIRHVNDTISEIFDITGFCDILTVE